jgi:hypothetical protein
MAIEIFRGDDKTLNLSFKDGNGNPINLSGSTIYFTAKKKIEYGDDQAVIQKDVTTHSDATAGTSVIQLSNTDTSITPDTYLYDIQYKTSGGTISTVLKDEIIIKPDVTRRND